MDNKLKNLIQDYLQKAKMMQVATAKDIQPWACTVYFAFDSSFNLYWISTSDRRHSQEIAHNEKVAGTIVLPHSPGDDVRGLQFEGVATELKGDAAMSGMKIYADRYGVAPKRVGRILDGTDGHMCYRIKPKMIVLFDEENFPDKPRQECKISSL